MINFVDKSPINGTRKIEGGYLVAVSKVARVGVQEYLASEVGMMGDNIVRVYRPPEEVFSDKSLATFSHAPVTIGHPTENVTADNWADLAVGEVSTVVKNDEGWVTIPLILKDSLAIKAVSDGMNEISMGYTSVLDHTSGVLEDGTKYDMVQRDIKINHLALVPKGRAGKKARIGDSSETWGLSPQQTRINNMEFETIVMGDAAVKVAVSDASSIKAFISKLTSDHEKAMADAKDKSDKDAGEKEEEFGKMKAELKTAKDSIVSDADIEVKVANRVAIVADAKSIAPDLVTDGLTEDAIMSGCVASKFGDEMIKDATPSEVKGMFKAALRDGTKPEDNSFRKVVKDGVTTKIADHGWGVALTKIGATKAK